MGMAAVLERSLEGKERLAGKLGVPGSAEGLATVVGDHLVLEPPRGDHRHVTGESRWARSPEASVCRRRSAGRATFLVLGSPTRSPAAVFRTMVSEWVD